MWRRAATALSSIWTALKAHFLRMTSRSPELPERFTPLPDDVQLLRVLAKTQHFFEPPDFKEPTPEAFKPNRKDVEEGERRNRPPGVSVFDERGCSASQAIAIREHFAAQGGRPARSMLTLRISVGTVKSLARTWNPDIDVVTDPITADDGEPLQLAGADAHALIEGLYEPDKTRRKSSDYKALLDRLATAAERIES